MKMAIIKKNQIIILVVSLMLITAGYLNYMYTDNLQVVSKQQEERNFGDATLVSSNNVTLDENQVENENIIALESSITSNEKEYFISTKLDRSKMYSSQLESYQNIIDSTTSTEEQKKNASEKITYINDIQNKIMIAENLIKLKNFEDVVILVNGESINIIIKAETLETKDVAQIQNIATRELNTNAENIHISNKFTN